MAANGVGVITKFVLSGTGLTQIAGPVYQVTLSLGGTNTCAVTSTAKDAAGTTQTLTGTKTYVSYGTGVATFVNGTITGVAKGQTVVEVQYPAFDNDGANALGTGMIYAQVVVTVTA